MNFRYISNDYLVFLEVLFLIGNQLSATILQEEFSLVNGTLVNAHRSLVLKRTDHSLELRELWHNFGGAFLVDSLRKPLGENKLILTLTGNVAQNQKIHVDGYAIVACHELGHVLGGSPRQARALSSWSSVEGQADYYATNQCMWRFVDLFVPQNFYWDFTDNEVKVCDEFYGHNSDKMSGCLRIISGILSMQNYFNNTSSLEKPVFIYKKDASTVENTLEKFPSNQCRLDTMMAGLLDQPRPSCWFKRE